MSTQTSVFLSKIIDHIIKSGASRLHLEAGTRPVMRVDQRLVSLEQEEIVTADFLEEVTDLLLDQAQRDKLKEKKSVLLIHTFEGRLRFKIHIFYQKNTLSLIFTYIPSVISEPAVLGLTQQFVDLVKRKGGLLVISGFQGAGRTTTVLSLLNYINQKYFKYILTLENPIEYILTSQKSVIEQREIGRDVINYVDGLKFARESDVDIVFLSEIKDFLTLKTVYDLIAEGKLVITITEASSSAETVRRLVNLSPAEENGRWRQILAENLLGIAVQQLVPRRGGGQLNVTEILIVNPAAVALIKEANYTQLTSVIQTSPEEGMRSLDRTLLELLKTEEVDYEVAVDIAVNKDDFRLAARKFIHMGKSAS